MFGILKVDAGITLGGALRVVHVSSGFKASAYDRALQPRARKNPFMKPAGFASTDVTARSAMMMVNRFILRCAGHGPPSSTGIWNGDSAARRECQAG